MLVKGGSGLPGKLLFSYAPTAGPASPAQVLGGSPAEKAGFKNNDQVEFWESEKIDSEKMWKKKVGGCYGREGGPQSLLHPSDVERSSAAPAP